jgi:hypothetical protein
MGDGRTGVSLLLARSFLPDRKTVPQGTNFSSSDGKILLGLRYVSTSVALSEVVSELESSAVGTTVTYRVQKPDWFVLAGETDQKKYYIRYHARPGAIAGMFVVIDKTVEEQFRVALTLSSLSLEPFFSTPEYPISTMRSTALLQEPLDLAKAVRPIAASQHVAAIAPGATGPASNTTSIIQPTPAATPNSTEMDRLLEKAKQQRDYIQQGLANIKYPKLSSRAVEVLSRLAQANEKMEIAEIKKTSDEADKVIAQMKSADEFARVAAIADARAGQITEELKSIVSDAPYIGQINASIATVRDAAISGSISEVQDALSELNKIYDHNKDQMRRDKFVTP